MERLQLRNLATWGLMAKVRLDPKSTPACNVFVVTMEVVNLGPSRGQEPSFSLALWDGIVAVAGICSAKFGCLGSAGCLRAYTDSLRGVEVRHLLL